MTKTRDKILRAAQECFRKQGIRQTSVLDIVTAAGIGRSTFYRQFHDVDEILVTLATAVLTDNLPTLATVLKQPGIAARQRWRDFIAAVVVVGQPYDARNPLFTEDMFLHVMRLFYVAYPEKRREIVSAFVPLFDAAKTDGELRTDIASDRMIEWIFRQAWALSSLPMASQWSHDELDDYIETFVLPTLLVNEGSTSECGAIRRLSNEIERLSHLVTRLESSANHTE